MCCSAFRPVWTTPAAALSLADGALQVTGLTGDLAGGKLAGSLTLNAAGSPHLAIQGALTGATLSGPLQDGTLDMTAGRMDVSAALQASGFSPGGLLASLGGTAQAIVTDGVLTGLDLAAVNAALDGSDAAAVQAGVTKALEGGSTNFSKLGANLTIHRGAVQLQQGMLTTQAGQATLSGTLDLPIDAADLLLALTPAHTNAPAIGLRLIGPAEAPRRTPQLAALAGWLAAR